MTRSARVPSIWVLLAIVAALTAAATIAVWIATAPPAEPAERRIEGLVLDGSGVTTTTTEGSRLRPAPDPIPARTIDQDER